MTWKDITRSIFYSFFIIYTITMIGLMIYQYLSGHQTYYLADLITIFIASILNTLAGIVLYSTKEPKRLEMTIRHVVHGILIFAITLGAATYMDWICWRTPSSVIQFASLILGIFVCVHLVIFYQNKRLADKLNQKLRERYHS